MNDVNIFYEQGKIMSTQSLFSKKNIESQQPDTRTGLMEEMNLPPAVIAFVRKNAQILQICLISVVVLMLAWVFYDYYTEKQEREAASLLATAMQTEATVDRIQMLENVINDYSGTDGARWSRLELAHLDYLEGRLDAAAARLEEIQAEVAADNPLVPLVIMNLAQIHEEAGNFDRAIADYTRLKKFPGFSEEAFLGLGRIYTAKAQPDLAVKEYEEFLSTMGDEADPQLRSQVQALLLSRGGETATANPEENKE